jgi:hypothetical protein
LVIFFHGPVTKKASRGEGTGAAPGAA